MRRPEVMLGVDLDDLFNLSYQTGKQVVIEVTTGQVAKARIHHDGWIYTLPEDEADLVDVIDKANDG